MPWLHDTKARMLEYLVDNEVRYRFPAPVSVGEAFRLIAQILQRNRDIPRHEIEMLSAMLGAIVPRED